MQREISLLRGLDHPNIVKYYQTDLSESLDSFDVVIEYVPGGTLKEKLISQGSFSEEQIRGYLGQLLEALVYLHALGIVHRDLKSANVLLAPDGTLKLADFGSSRRFEMEELAVSKSLKGSPYWMAPEVVRKEGHSYACDIWSLGCLLIEMKSGKPPWSEYTWEAEEVLGLIADPLNSPKVPECSGALSEVIAACLQREPSSRPSAAHLLRSPFFHV